MRGLLLSLGRDEHTSRNLYPVALGVLGEARQLEEPQGTSVERRISVGKTNSPYSTNRIKRYLTSCSSCGGYDLFETNGREKIKQLIDVDTFS